MSREFLTDEQPLWARLGYASETDYREAQIRRAQEAKQRQAQEAAQKHAAAGRDYGIVRKMRQRQKARERVKQWHIDNPERAKASDRAYYHRTREQQRIRRKAYYAAHRAAALLNARWWKQIHRQDLEWVERYNKRERERRQERLANEPSLRLIWNQKTLAWQRKKYAEDAGYREKVKQQQRERYAKRRNDPAFMEKKRTQGREWARAHSHESRERYANDAEYRERKKAQCMKRYAANREEINQHRREQAARKRAEKLAQQQQQAS